jgi:hypothetical protein
MTLTGDATHEDREILLLLDCVHYSMREFSKCL